MPEYLHHLWCAACDFGLVKIEGARRNMMTRKDKALQRTASIVAGLIVTYLSYFYASVNYGVLILFLGVGLTLWGCYLWTSLKNRHWLFMLWGLLSPIGLLGIALLEDKSANAATKDDTLPPGEGK
jgi:hypothetical protein